MSASGHTPAAERSASELQRRPRVRREELRNLGILLVFVGLLVSLSLASDVFLTSRNLRNILEQSAPLTIVACGGALVLIAGGFDLSVGAIFSLAGILAIKVANVTDPAIGMLAGVLVGAGLGAINGVLTSVVRINPLIATLGSGIIIGGVAVLVSHSALVIAEDDGFTTLGQDTFAGLELSAWVMIAWVVGCGLLLSRSVFGRFIYASGGNAEAARLSGVRVGLVRSVTYVISGAAAGLAGVIVASRVGTAEATSGAGMELDAIAAIVVGGVSILGGEGAIWRAVLGVLFIAVTRNGIDLLAIDPTYQQIITGTLLLGAVAVDVWTRSRAE